MVTDFEGFKLEVNIEGMVPHVRVTIQDGTVVVNTSALSVRGLDKLSMAIRRAAAIAHREYCGGL